MLYYLKLTNPVTKVYQDGFNQVEVSGSYLVARPRGYDLGSPVTNFIVKVGKMEFDESGDAIHFKQILPTVVNMTSEELSSWGTDDFDALKAIATKLELEVESSGSAEKLHFAF